MKIYRFGRDILLLILGLIFGALAFQLRQQHHEQKSKQVFEQRIRCKAIADKYVVQNEDAVLQEVEYSAQRNSCMAAIHTLGKDLRGWDLVDLLSGETINLGMCDESKDCGGGNDLKFEAALKEAFDRSLKTSLPLNR